MNDQLQQALATILSKTLDATQAGVSLLQAELPDVIQQLLIWKAVSSGLAFVGAVAIGTGTAWGLIKLWGAAEKKEAGEKNAWYRGEHRFFAAMVTLFAGGVGMVCTAALLNLTWLQILMAPKLYLIEYAAGLMK